MASILTGARPPSPSLCGLRAREIAESARVSETEPVWNTPDMDAANHVKQELLYLAHHGDESPFDLVGHAYLFAAAITRPFERASAPPAKDDASSMRYFYAVEARAFVERNYASNISVGDTASNCRLNRSYFERVFREEMGISPQEFLIRFRMSQAEVLLEHTDWGAGVALLLAPLLTPVKIEIYRRNSR